MQSGAVVEGFDVVEDGGASLGASSKATVINQFIFETAPEGLDEGIVVAVIGPTHGSTKMALGQDLAISGAGELTTAIGVKDEGVRGATLT